jgi:DNA-binding CsgD family transcriptional regulator
MERAERVAEVGSWELFLDTNQLVWSANLFRLFGLEPGEITPTADYVLSVVHPDDRGRVARFLAFLGEEGHLAPVEYRIVLPGGRTRRMRSTITALEAAGGGTSSIVGVVEDVTDEVSADHRIASHIAVTAALAAWHSLEAGGYELLASLAQATESHVATLWIPAGDALVARTSWTHPVHDATAFESATLRLRLRRGECLPGKVWQVGEPLGVADVRRHRGYLRRAAAERSCLRGAVALPALHADAVLAVLELNSREAITLGRRTMLSFRAIGCEIGQFLDRHRGNLHPTLTSRQLEVIQLAARGLSGREIAERLFISTTTVKSHFESIYDRLGVSDRASAVAEAMRCGLIG